ncbi:MAG: hypothetical protein KA715_14130 [Xanthomonadaceae bacterium]|nr:hypothetical protein [Xanthomonadaceae bacterium]
MKKYFYNFKLDFFFLSGITILIWCIVFTFTQGNRSDLIYQIAALTSWVVNWPHFAATSYRLYYRKDFYSQFPVTSFLIPILVLVATVFSLLQPESFAVIWIKLYLIWSPYHFCGQTLGLSLLYARRGEMVITPVQRFFLASFVYGSFITMTAISEIGEGFNSYYGVNYPRFNLNHQFVNLLMTWQYLNTAGFLISFYPHFKKWRSFPPLVLLLPLTHAFWFILGPHWPGFNEFVPALHSLQYLFIAWILQLSERHHISETKGFRFNFSSESLKWYGLNILLGAILFQVLPLWGERAGLPTNFAFGVIIASVQIHHFFVDGVIWKLKDNKILSPLMVNVEQWKHS